MITRRAQRKQQFLKTMGGMPEETLNREEKPFAALQPELIPVVLSFLVFNMNRYIRRIFEKGTTSVDYQSESFPNIPAEHIQSQLIALLYGTVQRRDVLASTQHTRNIFPLWYNIDFSLRSCYQLDQESDLTVDQLMMICNCLPSGCKYLNWRGNIHFNDQCINAIMKRSKRLQFLDLRATQIDFEGLKTILLIQPLPDKRAIANRNLDDFTVQYNPFLQILKLSRLSRAPLTEANVGIFKWCPKLTNLELINNGLHPNEIKKLICFSEEERPPVQPQHANVVTAPSISKFRHFTKLNLSCNSITDAGVKTLSICSSLHTLILEDCAITNEGLKHLLLIEQLTDDSSSLSNDTLKASNEELTSSNDRFKYHQLTRLTKLNVAHNRNITDEALVLISEHKTLKHLILSDTSISDECFKHLAENRVLQIVELANTKITNVGLCQFFGIAPKDESEENAEQAQRKAESISEKNSAQFSSNIMQTLTTLNIRFTQLTKEEVTRVYNLIKQHQQQGGDTRKKISNQFKIIF
jgi:hypothetical protein